MADEYIGILGAIAGVFIGFILNLARDWIQNRQNIKVNLKIDDYKYRVTGESDLMDIKLSAVNEGHRPVALINYELLVNGKIINFSIENAYHNDELIELNGDTLPYLLNEAQIYVAKINIFDLALVLKKEGYTGTVDLSGHYETTQTIIKTSKPYLLI